MRVALWDSHRQTVEAHFAGGDAVPGQTHLGRLYGWLSHHIFPLDRHPVPLELASLAAVLRRLHHTVEYFEDELPAGDIVVFRPCLATLHRALETIARTRRQFPWATYWVIGPVAQRWPHWFTQRGATVLKGDIEQLLGSFERVATCKKPLVHLGYVDDLDALPWPEWSWFEPQRFRLPAHFQNAPVGQVEHSRHASARRAGDAAAESPMLRYRSAERVVSELRHQIERYGFEAFMFTDPRFAAERQQAWRLVHLLGRLPRRIEFSIHCRPEDLDGDLLAGLAEVGLSTAAFTVATPSDGSFSDSNANPYRDFVARCRGEGVRTLALIPVSDGRSQDDRLPVSVARQIDATRAEFFWQPAADATVDAIGRFSPGWLNRYYLRPNYACGQWRQWMPSVADSSTPASPTSMPHADAAHSTTPEPMAGLDLIRRIRGLRKDSPHLRTPARRKHGPPSPHE